MKRLGGDLRKGFVKVEVENLDDLWYLTYIIDEGDLVKGKATRKIKLESGGEKTKVSKKTITVQIRVERIEFSKDGGLRLSGKLESELADVPKGSYQGMTIEERSVITITKEKWLSYQVDKLKEACEAKVAKVLICVFDRESALFALMKKYGYELILRLQGDVAKKREGVKGAGNFYKDILSKLAEYDKRYGLEWIILASPAFWKEDLLKVLKDDALKKKLILASCSSADERAINEVLRRDETRQALAQDRVHKELEAVEEVLSRIAKEGNVAYGLVEVANAAQAGAVEHLLVTDGLITGKREEGSFAELEKVMRLVDDTKGKVTIVSSAHEGGHKLQGLGGIAALLRYRL